MQCLTSKSWNTLERRAPEAFTHASRIWSVYVKQAHSLDKNLSGVAVAYINERDYVDITDPPLSVLVPVLLAEAFGVHDIVKVEKVVLASLAIDNFSHLLDDSTDSAPTSFPGTQSHLSHLLLSRATAAFVSLSSHPETFSAWFDRYLFETMTGEQALWCHRNAICEYSELDYQFMANRGSLVCICAAIYADISDKWHLLAPIEKGLRDAAVGIQLIDDLLDWENDLRDGIYTQPLVKAFKKINLEKALNEPTAIFSELFIAGAADGVIQRAAGYFASASCHFEGIGATGLKLASDDLRKTVEGMLSSIQDARASGDIRLSHEVMMITKTIVRMQH